MSRRLLGVAFIGLISLFVPVLASEGDGGQAADWLRLGMGARSLAMAGAFTAIAEGYEAAFYNPGGLAFNFRREAAFSLHRLSLDRKLNSVGMVLPVRDQAVIGLWWVYASVDNVFLRDSDRNIEGELTNNNNSFGLSFAKRITPFWAAGANLRYLQSKLHDYQSFAVGVDLGTAFFYNRWLGVGLTVRHLGSSYSWDSWAGEGNKFKEKFPVEFRWGISAGLWRRAVVGSVDLVKEQYKAAEVHAGAEFWLQRSEKNLPAPHGEDQEELDEEGLPVVKRYAGLRLGIDDGSFSCGGTIVFPLGRTDGGLDYAYLTGKSNAGACHIFSLRVMF